MGGLWGDTGEMESSVSPFSHDVYGEKDIIDRMTGDTYPFQNPLTAAAVVPVAVFSSRELS